jgi:predicted RNA binding protein YcfA (HicA-like mRNA interferase family)
VSCFAIHPTSGLSGFMSKLPVVSGTETIKALYKNGFTVERQRSSHVLLKKDDTSVTVPLHSELDRGTLRAIIDQAHKTKEEFLRHLR